LLLDEMTQSSSNHVVIIGQEDADHARFSHCGVKVLRTALPMNRPVFRRARNGSSAIRDYVAASFAWIS
jgi:hypothetical protein